MRPLRALIVAADPAAAERLADLLRRGGFVPAWERVDRPADLRTALTEGLWDIVLVDGFQPELGAETALRISRTNDPEQSFLIVAPPGTTAAERALAGTDDCFPGRDPAELAEAVNRELKASAGRRARRAAERLGQVVLDSLPAHIAVLGQDGTILAVNAAWTRFAHENGYIGDPTGGIGANYLDICGHAAGPFADEAPTARAGIREVLAGKSAGFVLEYPCHAPHLERWFLLHVAPLAVGAGAVASHTDITVRKQAERAAGRTAAIVRASSEAIIGDTLDGFITDWNPAAERLFGWSAEEAVGRRVRDFIPPERLGELENSIARIKATGEAIEIETVRNRKDGTAIDVAVTISPVRDVQGRLVGFSRVGRDISERKKAAAALAERTRLVAFTAGIGKILVEGTDLGTILAEVAAAIAHDLGGFEARILAYNPAAGIFERDVSPALRDFPEAAIVAERTSLVCLDLVADARFPADLKATAAADGAAVFLGLPLCVPDRIVGVLTFRSRLPLSAAERIALEGVAASIAVRMDRARAEDELRAGEERFRAFMDHCPAAAFIKDREGRYVYVNPTWLRQFDPEPTDWFGKTDHDLWPPATAELFRASDLGCLSREKVLQTEETGPAADGRSHTWLVMKFPLFMGSRRKVGGMAWDISDRKRAEEAVLDALERLRGVVEQSADGIITIDERGTIETVNPAVGRIFGYAPDEIVGKNVSMLMPQPYRREHDGYLAAYVETGDRKIIGIGREVRGQRKDGGEFPADLSVSEVRVGERRLFTGIVRDITERKRAEAKTLDAFERLRGVVEQSADGIITIDERGTIESVNPAVARIFGYLPDEILGQNVSILMPQPFHGEHDGYLASYAATGERKIIGIGREVRGRRKDGGEFPADLSVSEVRLGERRLFTGIVRDITDRKRAEEKLRDSEARLATVLRCMPVGVVAVEGPTGRLVLCNEQVERIFRHPPVPTETVADYTRWRGFHPDGRPFEAVDWPAARAWLHGEFVDAEEVTIGRGDGTRGAISISAAPLFDAAGEITGSVAVLVDVTERREVERALRESEARLAEAVRLARMGYWNCDIASGALTWSDELYGMFGVARETFVGTYEGFLALIHAGDREDVRQRIAAAEALGSEGRFEHDYRVTVRGETRTFQEVGRMIADADGRVVRVTGTAQDITERRRTEESLARDALVLSRVRDSVIVTDLAGIVTYWNDGAARLYGRPAAETVGRSLLETMPAEARPETAADLARFAAGGEFRGERQAFRCDGSRMWVDAHVYRYDGSDGRPAGVIGISADITERKRAEQALSESHRRFEETLNAVSDLFVAFDRDWNYTYLNQKAAAFTGHRPDDLIGKNIWETFPESAGSVFREELVAAAETQTIRRFEAHYRHLGRRYEHRVYPHPRGVSLFSSDVTEQHRAAAALRAGEARFRAFMNHNPAAAWITDAAGRFAYVSETYLKTFRLPTGDPLGKTVFEVYPADIADTYAANIRWVAEHDRVLETTEPGIRLDGSLGEFIVFKFPLPNPDGLALVGGIAVDVTERKKAEVALRESEERLRHTITSAPFPAMIHAEGGEVLLVSDVWSDLTGYEPAEIRTIAAWTELAYGPRASEVAEFVAALFDLTDRDHNGEFPIRTRSGAVLIWDFWATPLGKLPDGRRVVLSMAVDVTEQRAAAAAVREAQQRLLERERREKEIVAAELEKTRKAVEDSARLAALGQMAAGIAHDIRNPLGAVRNAAFYLRRKVPPQEKTWIEFLDIIDQEVSTCDIIITNLLELARPKRVTAVPLDLGMLIRAALGRLGMHRGVRFKVVCVPVPTVVRADPVQLRQVFDNLLKNAVDAVRGNGTVKIEALAGPDGARIRVADSGPGVPADLRDKLFEPLFTTKAKGTGLGLWICRQVLERHGGSIRLLDSAALSGTAENPGSGETQPQGAVFEIRLPGIAEEGGDKP